MYYPSSPKFINLAVLSTVISLGLSSLFSQPSLALSSADLAWAEGFGIPLHTINDAHTQTVEDDLPAGSAEADTLAASENQFITREEVLLSSLAFVDSIVLLTSPIESEFYQYELIHGNAAKYLARRMARLTSDANSLLEQAQSKAVSGTQISGTQISESDSTPDKLRHRTLAPKQADTLPFPPSDIDPDAFYAVAARYLSEHLNLTFDDGTFRPSDLLTQSQYLDYLQQIDRLIAQQRYSEDSLLTLGDPTEWVMRSGSAEVAGTALSGLLDQVTTVEALMDELSALQNIQNKGNPSGPTTEKAVQAHPSRHVPAPVQPLQLAQLDQSFITLISEIPDVSPEDSFYEPLRMLVEEYGFDPVLTAGQFSSQTPITRGEAAIYLVFAIDFTVIMHRGRTLYIARGDYERFSEELQVLEQALSDAISQYP